MTRRGRRDRRAPVWRSSERRGTMGVRLQSPGGMGGHSLAEGDVSVQLNGLVGARDSTRRARARTQHVSSQRIGESWRQATLRGRGRTEVDLVAERVSFGAFGTSAVPQAG